MALIEDNRLIINICRLFYEEEFSQKEIACKLAISRPQVSRLLTYARREGWVTITIHNPYVEENALEQKLAAKYGLRQAMVINTGSRDGDGAWELIGRHSGMKAAQYILNYKSIGIMSGRSIFQVLDKAVLPHNGALTFVSLVGGMGVAGAQWHANYMSQRLAEKTGGKAYLLNAPLFVQNEAMRKTLIQEEAIQHVYKRFKECKLIFAGIGQIDTRATLADSGILKKDDIELLKKNGAAAAVGGVFFNRYGEIQNEELTRRFIGIGYAELRACPNVVAIAIGGEKINAIDAALRSGIFHELITNSETAKALLKKTGKKNI